MYRFLEMMIRTTALILMIFCSFSIHAQDPSYLELVRVENRLEALFSELYDTQQENTDSLLAQIEAIMPDALEKEGAMAFPWDGLSRIGVVDSDDGEIRIFTWHVADDPETYRYFGYIQVAQRRGNVKVFKLEDNKKPQTDRQNLDQSLDNWYGKLYYEIVTTRHRRDTYYTLLGMDFKNARSNIKTIEVLRLRFNRPRFEQDLISMGDKTVDRLVLEYSTQVAISVRYDPTVDMIAFDHLVPFHPIYEGNYDFYGPDGSYDGLEFEDGVWIYRKDIDARNID